MAANGFMKAGPRANARLLVLVAIVYMLLILHGSLAPFDLHADGDEVRCHYSRVWACWPFGDRFRTSKTDVVSNFALYVPLGFLVAVSAALRRRAPRWPAVLAAAAASLAVGSGVEVVQLFSLSRVSSAQDALVNSLGGLVGGLAGAWSGRRWWLGSHWRLRWMWAHRPVTFIALAMLLALGLEATYPYIPMLGASKVVANVMAMAAHPLDVPGGHPWYYWAFWRAGAYGLLTAAMAFSFTVRPVPRWGKALALSAGLAAGLEVAKVFIVSRSADLANVVVSAGAALVVALVGAAIVRAPKEQAPIDASAPPSRAAGVYLVLLTLYVAFIVYGSLVPLTFRYLSFEQALRRFADIRYLELGIGRRGDLVANLVFYIPVAFLAMGSLTRGGRAGGLLWKAMFVGLSVTVLAVAVEFTQVYFPSRTVSQNDIMMEIIGGMVGVGVWLCLGGRVTRWAGKLWVRPDKDRLPERVLAGYAVFLVLYMLFPFDLVIGPEELVARLRGPKLILLPFTDQSGWNAYVIAHEIALFGPIGYLLMLRQARKGRSTAWAVGWLVAIVAGMEAVQVFVHSRYSSTTDLIYGVAGGLAGMGFAWGFAPTARRPVVGTAFWARWGRRVKLTASVGLLGLLAWEKLRPFDFTMPAGGLAAGLAEAMAVPLARQHGLSELNAVAQAVRELASFFALGALLRSLWVRPGGGGVAIAATVAGMLPIALELAQGFLPSRTADLTAMFTGAAGGLAGVFLLPTFRRVFLWAPHDDGAGGRPGVP